MVFHSVWCSSVETRTLECCLVLTSIQTMHKPYARILFLKKLQSLSNAINGAFINAKLIGQNLWAMPKRATMCQNIVDPLLVINV